MKRIEDIEILDDAQLEAAALNEAAPVPEGLEDRLKAVLAAKAASEQAEAMSRDRGSRWLPYAALAAAAAVAAVIVLPRIGRPPLRDTFDDPYLAYAEVEATFRTISDRMNAGLEMASQARETAEIPMEIIDNINRK